MSIYDVPVKTLFGEETSLKEHANDAMLIVNVASRGITCSTAALICSGLGCSSGSMA